MVRVISTKKRSKAEFCREKSIQLSFHFEAPFFSGLELEMTEPPAVNGVGESGRFAPTFTHPQTLQSPVTSSQKTK